jgi:exopolyphosphatase/pppGpp-phosphohydrolase
MLLVMVHNDGTGTKEIANYDYEVRINHDVIAHGRIADHNRGDGWRALLREIADQHQASVVNDLGDVEE